MHRETEASSLVEFNLHRDLIKQMLISGYTMARVHRMLMYEKKLTMHYQSFRRLTIQNQFPYTPKKRKNKNKGRQKDV